jgi:hypothetical protein
MLNAYIPTYNLTANSTSNVTDAVQVAEVNAACDRINSNMLSAPGRIEILAMRLAGGH